MIVVYDAGPQDMSEGPKSLAAPVYYARLTQALVGALTVQTAEGALYEVDMRLRPSGRQGPVATSLTAFAAYQMSEAWTWEHLALSRARVIAGPKPLQSALSDAVQTALAMPRNPENELADVREMRARIASAREGADFDPWDMKLGRGRMQDIELCLQTGKVLNPQVTAVAPMAMIPPLIDVGWLTKAEGDFLRDLLRRLTAVQGLMRLAVEADFSPERGGPGLCGLIAEVTGTETIETLEAEIMAASTKAAGLIDAVLEGRG